MALHQLPLELLFTILSHLAADRDDQALHACALTCKALVSPAQAHIFHTTWLMDGILPTVLSKLESTPHIRTLIKRLDIIEMNRPWIQGSDMLHQTLGLLSPSVVSLNIFQRRCRPKNPRFDYSSLSELKNLEEITLKEEEENEFPAKGNTALPTFLNQFPKLRAITFHRTVLNQTIDNKNEIPPPVFRLERLNLRSCHDALVLEWLVPALSSLQKLRFMYPEPNPLKPCTTVVRYIIAAGEALQHLEVIDLNGLRIK